MCGRFALVSDLKTIQEKFHVQDVQASYHQNWNISHDQEVPAMILHNGRRKLVGFQWGWVPAFHKVFPSRKLINARAETVDKKPSFQEAFRRKRCLIIADGFYEWKKDGKRNIPFFFYLKSGEPFGFAGLYENRLSAEGRWTGSCVIITTQANDLVASVHNRMPVILSHPQDQAAWLTPNVADFNVLLSLLKPSPAKEMVCKPADPSRVLPSGPDQAAIRLEPNGTDENQLHLK